MFTFRAKPCSRFAFLCEHGSRITRGTNHVCILQTPKRVYNISPILLSRALVYFYHPLFLATAHASQGRSCLYPVDAIDTLVRLPDTNTPSYLSTFASALFRRMTCAAQGPSCPYKHRQCSTRRTWAILLTSSTHSLACLFSANGLLSGLRYPLNARTQSTTCYGSLVFRTTCKLRAMYILGMTSATPSSQATFHRLFGVCLEGLPPTCNQESISFAAGTPITSTLQEIPSAGLCPQCIRLSNVSNSAFWRRSIPSSHQDAPDILLFHVQPSHYDCVVPPTITDIIKYGATYNLVTLVYARNNHFVSQVLLKGLHWAYDCQKRSGQTITVTGFGPDFLVNLIF